MAKNKYKYLLGNFDNFVKFGGVAKIYVKILFGKFRKFGPKIFVGVAKKYVKILFGKCRKFGPDFFVGLTFFMG